MIPLGQHPLPTHVVAHLSDPHLLAGERRLYGAVDTQERLRTALRRLRHLELPPQVLVFTGDLADTADPEAYRALRAIVEPVAADLGAEVVWVMGNHDERAAYARGLFDNDAGTDDQDRVHEVAGLRIVALDTTVPGYHHGELSSSQLDWLREVLTTPAEHGTLLALHHPPIPVPLLRSGEIIELFDQHLLAEVITGSDVRAVIGGHFHLSSFSTFAGVPVSVASSTCYTCDPAPDDRFLSGVDGAQAITMLHLYGPPTDRVVYTVVPVPAAPEVNGYPLSIAVEVEALSPADRRELLSRKDSSVWAQE